MGLNLIRPIAASCLLIASSICVSAQSATDQPLETTTCEISASPERFDGKLIRLKGTILAGFEVFAIADPRKDCERIWLSYDGGGPSASTSFGAMTPTVTRPAVTVRQDGEFKKMQQLLEAEMYPRNRDSICMDCHRYLVSATFTGRLDVAGPGSGFGHMNGYRSRFVLQSVTDVSAEDLSKNYDLKDYSTEKIRFPNGYLTGMVTGPDGKPIWGISVEAMETSYAEEHPIYLENGTVTDHTGHFKLELRPGSYLVGINLTSPPSASFPYPPTYFPNTIERKQAKAFTISDRQTVRADFHLPATLPTRKVSVKVIWPDGTVVVDANVWLAEQQRPSQVVGNSVSHTDINGRFDLIGFSGVPYVVRANIYLRPGYVPHCAEKRLISASESITAPIVMTLTRTGNVCRSTTD